LGSNMSPARNRRQRAQSSLGKITSLSQITAALAVAHVAGIIGGIVPNLANSASFDSTLGKILPAAC
jgi:hypothetical protein